MALLGSHPEDAPGLYAMMSYADYKQGVFYPKGGIGKLFTAIFKLSKKLGVEYKFNFDITSFKYSNNKINSVISSDGHKECADIVIMNGDYAHTELKILEKKYQTYDEKYWASKKIGASAFIVYLGVNKKLKNLQHHNLFLDRDWKEHFKHLSDSDTWPEKPAYYLSLIHILIATILSAQCTDARVNMVTPVLFSQFPTPLLMSRASHEEVSKIIFSTGFYNQKAKKIINTSIKIVEDFAGNVPDEMNDLIKLPGVARKTANAVSYTHLVM